LIRAFIIIAVLLFAGIVYSFVSCVQKKNAQAEPSVFVDSVLKENFRTEILDSTAFECLAGAPLSDKLNRVTSVKLCYDLSKKTLYFINSKRYELHYDFCCQALGYSAGLMIFNSRNYTSNIAQEYILASLNHYKDQNKYVLELTGNTNLDIEGINLLYNTIAAKTFLSNSVFINNNSAYLEEMTAKGQITKPIISPTELYRNQIFQCVEKGIVYGHLKMVADLDKNFGKIDRTDIIITKGTPLNIPPCASLITDAIQSPLSHIQVLCHNRHTPSACDINIWNNHEIAALNNQMVKVVINTDGLWIEKSSEEEFTTWLKKQIPEQPISIQSDLMVKTILPIAQCRLSDRSSIGNKAAAFGELAWLSKKHKSLFAVPENACAIPFYFYHQHIQNSNIQIAIQEVLSAQGGIQDSLAKALKGLRKAIESVPVDPDLIKAIEDHIKKDNQYAAYRFRSSCNAEDIEGFSGAGLYTSKTGMLNSEDKSIERAVKKVWASAWSYAAFQEREIHHINHRDIEMGILVHRSFPEEAENGVAITRNLYRPQFIGFTINIQKGDVSVVQPNDSVMCEQFICMDGSLLNVLNNDITTESITYSSLEPGRSLLTIDEIESLYKALELVENHFYYTTRWSKNQSIYYFGVDVEFKFDQNGQLYLKQVRPYE
jgi:pyruvate, water dikinase